MKKIITILKKYLYISAITLIVLIFVSYFLSIRYFYPIMSDSGLFGDMFGGINALFSGFAFLGVIYAIILQRKELQLQRKELELTRKELERTAQAQENSEKALSKQAESLEVTSKLNGLSSILQYHGSLIEAANGEHGRGGIDRPLKTEAEKIKKEIQKLMEINS